MTDHAIELQPKQDLLENFFAVDRKFMEVRNRLWQLESLFEAMTSLDCLVNPRSDGVHRLADMGGDVARLGDKDAEDFETTFDALRNRVLRQPSEGDPVPVGVWAQMLEIASLDLPVEDSEQMWRWLELANTLNGYVNANPEAWMEAALGAFLAMLERKGASIWSEDGPAGMKYYFNWRPGFDPVNRANSGKREATAPAS